MAATLVLKLLVFLLNTMVRSNTL